jgi:hypothetical protein
MKNAFVQISLSAVTLLGLAAPGVLSADCFPSAGNGYRVPFSMITLKNFNFGSQYASYASGMMDISNTNTWYATGTTLNSEGQVTQLFSDRIFPDQYNLQQPFNVLFPDAVGVSASNVKSTYSQPIGGPAPDPGGGSVTLINGSRTTIFGVSCNAATGELYGAASADTFVVITFGPPQAPVQVPN